MAEESGREILDRVARESGTLAGSPLGRAGRRIGEHFAGADARGTGEGGEPDPMELWGRRIGRALSVVLFVFLVAWLLSQLGAR